MAESFDALAAIILKYPNLLQRSRFVFVPGLSDPGHGNVLPRPGECIATRAVSGAATETRGPCGRNSSLLHRKVPRADPKRATPYPLRERD
jgi:hypothetical protein